MNDDPGAGGTRIQRRPPPPQQAPQQAPHYSQQPVQQQASQAPHYSQQPVQQPVQQQPVQQQQPIYNISRPLPVKSTTIPTKPNPIPTPSQTSTQSVPPKSTFNMIKQHFGSGSTPSFRYSVYVVIIFVLLNSKMIWKQICRLPLMGSVEPSIIALIFNSILAGLVFYILTKFT